MIFLAIVVVATAANKLFIFATTILTIVMAYMTIMSLDLYLSKDYTSARPSLPLPPELRLRILEYVLVCPEIDLVLPAQQHPFIKGSFTRNHRARNGAHAGLDPAVLRVNKLMYAEAADVLYKKNAFRFGCNRRLDAWLDAFQQNEATIRRIPLHMKSIARLGNPLKLKLWLDNRQQCLTMVQHVLLFIPFRIPNVFSSAERWDLTLVRLGRELPNLQALTLITPWGAIMRSGTQEFEAWKKTLIELLLASGIRGLKVLRLDRLDSEDEKEVMAGLRPMLREG